MIYFIKFMSVNKIPFSYIRKKREFFNKFNPYDIAFASAIAFFSDSSLASESFASLLIVESS